MARRQSYLVEVSERAKGHLRGIERKHHSSILNAIEEQLSFEPGSETRNRKRLRDPVMGGGWELRCGPKNSFRVCYNVDEENHAVEVVAIGLKEKDELRFPGEEEET